MAKCQPCVEKKLRTMVRELKAENQRLREALSNMLIATRPYPAISLSWARLQAKAALEEE